MHRRKYVWTVSLLSVTCNKYYKAQTHICIRACPHIEHGQAHVHVQREWPFIKQVTSAVSNAMGGQTRVTRHSHTQNRLTALFRDCPGRPIPEETFTHSHPSWSLNILYRLPPFTTVHNILFVQFMYLTVLFDNLCPGPLWSSSWSWTLNFILHALLHPIIIFFSQHMPIPSQLVLL